jgi:hypothetical protein
MMQGDIFPSFVGNWIYPQDTGTRPRLRSGVMMGRLLSSGLARPMGQQLLRDADEHLSDVLLLAD